MLKLFEVHYRSKHNIVKEKQNKLKQTQKPLNSTDTDWMDVERNHVRFKHLIRIQVIVTNIRLDWTSTFACKHQHTLDDGSINVASQRLTGLF